MIEQNKQQRIFNLPNIIAVLVLITAIVLNTAIPIPLFELGINFIFTLQTSGNQALRIFMVIISLICNPIIVIPILGIELIAIRKKLIAIVGISAFLFANYVLGLAKAGVNQPRPFWVNGNIQMGDIMCPGDLGNPSGHTFAAFMLYQPLLLQIFQPPKIISIFLMLVIGILVPLSRLYLGVHSLDQVAFGAVIGLTFLVFYRNGFKQLGLRAFWNSTTVQSLKSKLFIVLGCLIIQIAFILIPYGIYFRNTTTNPLNPSYVQGYNLICNVVKNNQNLQASMLTSQIPVHIIFGFIYSTILFKSKYLVKTLYFGKYKLAKPLSATLLFVFVITIPQIPAIAIFIVSQVVKMPVILKVFLQAIVVTYASIILLVGTVIGLEKYPNIIAVTEVPQQSNEGIASSNSPNTQKPTLPK